MSSSVRLENLDRSWGSFALREVSLEVAEGEYFVLLGPTGSGKTLLLETIAGLHRPESGRIFLGDRDVTDSPPEKRMVGLVYQRSMLFPHLSVYENIAFGLRFHKTGQGSDETVQRLAKLLGLGRHLARRPDGLSGGELQKVALARALAIDPQILLLDEPLSPLDEMSKAELREKLKELNRQTGTTVFEVTHDQRSARLVADRVGLIDRGRIIQSGLAKDVFEGPSTLFAARFLGWENVLSAREAGEAGLSVPPGAAGCAIRAENVRFLSTPPADKAFAAELKQVQMLGSRISSTLAFRNLVVRVLTSAEEFQSLGVTVGDSVNFSFPDSAVRVLEEE